VHSVDSLRGIISCAEEVHRIKVALGTGIPLLCRFGVPLESLRIVLVNAFA